MHKCAADPLVIRIGQVRAPHSGPGLGPGQDTATIFTRSMPTGSRQVPLLTCLRSSPVVLQVAWPD
jgi:hypothetical protein